MTTSNDYLNPDIPGSEDNEVLSNEELAAYLAELGLGDDDIEAIEESTENATKDQEFLDSDDSDSEDTPKELQEREAKYNSIPVENDDEVLDIEKLEDNAWFIGSIWTKDEKGRFKNEGRAAKLKTEDQYMSQLERAALARQVKKDNALKRKQRRIEIQRAALNQDLIDLSQPISTEHMKRLVYLLSKKHIDLINKYHTYITKRIEVLLSALTPITLRRAFKKYPQAFIVHPGFMYKASKKYGNGIMFWVTPHIPYYIAQGKEVEALKKEKARFLRGVDCAILRLETQKRLLADREVSIAMAMIRMPRKTYFNLLKYNPFWFDLLINDLKTKGEP